MEISTIQPEKRVIVARFTPRSDLLQTRLGARIGRVERVTAKNSGEAQTFIYESATSIKDIVRHWPTNLSKAMHKAAI